MSNVAFFKSIIAALLAIVLMIILVGMTFGTTGVLIFFMLLTIVSLSATLYLLRKR